MPDVLATVTSDDVAALEKFVGGLDAQAAALRARLGRQALLDRLAPDTNTRNECDWLESEIRKIEMDLRRPKLALDEARRIVAARA